MSILLEDAHRMNLLSIEDSSIFGLAEREGWHVTSFNVDKLIQSRRQIQLLWEEYKVLRMSRLCGLHLCDQLKNITIFEGRIYFSIMKGEIDLKKLLEMGNHLPETQSAVRALIDAVS